MEKEEMKYEQAVRELEEIVERMENDETIVSDEMKLNNLFRNISAINA